MNERAVLFNPQHLRRYNGTQDIEEMVRKTVNSAQNKLIVLWLGSDNFASVNVKDVFPFTLSQARLLSNDGGVKSKMNAKTHDIYSKAFDEARSLHRKPREDRVVGKALWNPSQGTVYDDSHLWGSDNSTSIREYEAESDSALVDAKTKCSVCKVSDYVRLRDP